MLMVCSIAMAAIGKELPSAILHYHDRGHYGWLLLDILVYGINLVTLQWAWLYVKEAMHSIN